MIIQIPVDSKFIGSNIRTLLSSFHVGKKTIYQYSSNHGLLINDKPVNSEYIIKANDKLSIVLSTLDRFIDAEPNIDILYEDQDVVVVKKPRGLLTHNDGNDFNTLTDRVNAYFDSLGYHHEILPAHRIDVDTLGMIVFAKHEIALADLSYQFENRLVKKIYHAKVDRKIFPKKGTIRKSIFWDRIQQKMVTSSKGLKAITHYKVIKENELYSLLEVEIETGRTHQIRVHLASLGFPIVGDELYGQTPGELELLFKKVEFIQPLTRKLIKIELQESLTL